MRPTTDIWFRSDLDLEELGHRLGLSNLSLASENYWAWVIGGFQDAMLDITRTHTIPPHKTDTRIFRYDETKTFDELLLSDLVSKLHKVGISPIYSGEWIYTKGNDFKKEVYATHKVAEQGAAGQPLGFPSASDVLSNSNLNLASDVRRHPSGASA